MSNDSRIAHRALGFAAALALFAGPALAQGTTYIGPSGPSVRVDLSVLDALGPEPTLPNALRGTLPGASAAAGGRTSILRPPSAPAQPAALKPPAPRAAKEAAKPAPAAPKAAAPAAAAPKLTPPKTAAPVERAQPKPASTPAPARTPSRPLPEAITPPPAPTAVLTPPPAPARPAQPAAAPPPAATAPATAPAASAARPAVPSALTASLPPGGGLPSLERPLRVRFAAQSADLPEQSKTALGQLAQRLKDNETPRIQLIAYAEGTAETASQARRLSLQRALALRTYLIDQGVRGNRMDVRALGNKIEDDGPADRVDIIVTER